MIFLLPFNIISIIFILIFFNVIFLTQENLNKSKNIINNQLDVFDKKFQIDRDKILTLVIQEKKLLAEKKLSEQNSLKEKKIVKKELNKNLGKVIIESLPPNIQQYFVQYGVYKTKKNLIELEKLIENKLKPKFKNINLLIIQDKKNGLYRLVLPTNKISFANDVCKYSKSLKFECYVKK